MFYDILKSFHLIAVISWMVGLLYLPRLFVYHNETKYLSEMDTTFLLMERRLLSYIMLPAVFATYFFGLIIVFNNLYFFQEPYFLAKLLLVFCLTIFQWYLSILYKDFKKGYRIRKTNFYRLINEIPTVLMIAIILLIFVKPNFQVN